MNQSDTGSSRGYLESRALFYCSRDLVYQADTANMSLARCCCLIPHNFEAQRITTLAERGNSYSCREARKVKSLGVTRRYVEWLGLRMIIV
jgi:hypothetical protein